MTERQKPELAVSAAIFKDGRVLLVRRAQAPAKDVWTLPGGRVEVGETLVECVTREIAEETGLAIDVVGLAGYREMILPADVGARGRHFVILPFAAHWRAGDVVLNEELAEFQWLPPDRIDGLRTTEGLGPILLMAHRLALAGAEK
jgi:ADP-ribose pyrophosphatase YjhB (NUDIX family)